MADLLKITTPVAGKNQIQPTKHAADPSNMFSLSEMSKVLQSQPLPDTRDRGSGMNQREDAPTILMDLLKDPSVTVNFLKNIYMLQEIIKLLPINNDPVAQEIEQLFEALMVAPDAIAQEMKDQEDTSTVFKGALFDFLRETAASGRGDTMKAAVATLLKSINCTNCRQDVLHAMSNGLGFLAKSLESSKSLAGRLLSLAQSFREDDAAMHFGDLKADTFALLEEVENSILFTPKLKKVVAILQYNLSRFNDNPDFFQEAISNLLTNLDGAQKKTEFLRLVREFLNERNTDKQDKSSKVMDVLAKILGKQSDSEPIQLMNAEKIERIIHSLLSSPCNFTPLLHYVIPVEFMGLKAFAELWINPNGGEDERPVQRNKDTVHMLIVFDIEGIGQFEAELFADTDARTVELSLRCPPAYTAIFAGMNERLNKAVASTKYSFSNIRVDKLEKTRSLMDVFKSLPYKRTGVDVKV